MMRLIYVTSPLRENKLDNIYIYMYAGKSYYDPISFCRESEYYDNSLRQLNKNIKSCFTR